MIAFPGERIYIIRENKSVADTAIKIGKAKKLSALVWQQAIHISTGRRALFVPEINCLQTNVPTNRLSARLIVYNAPVGRSAGGGGTTRRCADTK
jgi:hypothetical protein